MLFRGRANCVLKMETNQIEDIKLNLLSLGSLFLISAAFWVLQKQYCWSSKNLPPTQYTTDPQRKWVEYNTAFSFCGIDYRTHN